MNTQIALLRGINVSGQKKIKMAHLRAALENSELRNVNTYIQSGNIVFESKLSVEDSASFIHKQIKKEFGFEVPVTTLTKYDLEKIVSHNPYPDNADFEEKKCYICYLDNVPKKENVTTLKQMDFGEDQWKLQHKTMYIYYAEGYSKSKLVNNLIEKKLGVSATTRNWRTTNKLLEMAHS